MSAPDPTAAARIVGLFADTDRLTVVASLVLGAATLDEIRSASGLEARAAVDALGRLVSSGLVVGSGSGPYVLMTAMLRDAARDAAPAMSPPGVSGDERILATFVVDGRLRSIPTQRSKRRVVLDRIAQDFEPGLRYSEPEVNAIVGRWHDDHAAIRRYLIDESFLDRDHGTYWRSGGSVETGDQVVGS